jgi:general secretion pathway protein F
MPAYAFEAVNSQGQTRKGVVEADTARSARSQLRAQGLIPLEVLQVKASASADGEGMRAAHWLNPKVFNGLRLAIWTRQLAGLVAAGLTLERALSALMDDIDAPAQRNLLAALRAEVNAGASFGHALAQHPREFDPIYVAVIRAGEQSGHLGQVLNSLADDLEESQTLRNKLVAAALYPAIVSLVAVAIVLFLMGYVVPQVANVFAGSKHALPFLTVAMLALSDAIRAYGLWLLGLLLLAGWAFRLALKQADFRLRFDAFWLQLPLLGTLSRGYNAARFASTLAMLSAAGVPILKALQAAAQTLSNQAMRADALDTLVLVREGAPLGSALAQKKNFPGLLAMFARLGEQTGQLPTMLQRAAQQLSGEVQRRALQWATVLEPLLIVGMGLVVMLIVLAVLMPIMQLNQLVK